MITSEKVTEVLLIATNRMADRHKISSDKVSIRIFLNNDDHVCYQVRVNNIAKEYVTLDMLIGRMPYNVFIKGHFKKIIRILAAEHDNANPHDVSILIFRKEAQEVDDGVPYLVIWLYVGSQAKTKLSIKKLL